MTGGTQGSVVSGGPRGKADQSADRSLSTETIFETLSSRRRRYVLHYLTQRDERVTVRDLSMQIAAWENGIERDAVTPKERKRVYTALHQTHLPKMHRLGVVAYNDDRGTVGLTDCVRDFDIYLDVVSGDDIPWSQFYLALGGVLSALVVIAALGVQPFSAVGGFGYALFVALAFTAVGAYHTSRDRKTVLGRAGTPPDVVAPPETTEQERSD
jgi:Flp pilus assembly protein TadB